MNSGDDDRSMIVAAYIVIASVGVLFGCGLGLLVGWWVWG